MPLRIWALAGALACGSIARADAVADQRETAPGAVTTGSLAATLLARPLFAPSRRPDPADAAAAIPGEPTGLPRLTGVMVSGTARRAIFARAGGEAGPPIVVEEGGQIGAYHVQRIGRGSVTLTAPDGVRVLAPRFSDSPAEAAPLSIPNYAVVVPPLNLGPERFEAPVGPAGIAMYRYSPAAPHTPPPVPNALTAP